MEEQTLSVVQEKAVGAYTHTFKEPFSWQGHTFEELTFDFASLTGGDSLAIEEELLLLNKTAFVPALSGEYLVRMAARACTTVIQEPGGRRTRIGTDALRAMPITEYNAIIGRARNFLLSAK
ncbi:hypothetical protein [Anaeromassilibacillus sp. An200]|uniref:hypothetical protein n=1 Tax=Anaeromassilibacillus sp. An200 TaxID=1965587 RepID=UPI000B366D5F|nr:hypothetical protein [Anaeromassilibacillus sp. An200]OUP12553.1 hypothetical protein B5F35_08405 [Anaeromassilibacillus sp. An200]